MYWINSIDVDYVVSYSIPIVFPSKDPHTHPSCSQQPHARHRAKGEARLVGSKMPSLVSVEATYLAFNFASAVGIVFVNKWVFDRCAFVWSTALTVLHYLLSWLGLEACALCGAARPPAPHAPAPRSRALC